MISSIVIAILKSKHLVKIDNVNRLSSLLAITMCQQHVMECDNSYNTHTSSSHAMAVTAMHMWKVLSLRTCP